MFTRGILRVLVLQVVYIYILYIYTYIYIYVCVCAYVKIYIYISVCVRFQRFKPCSFHPKHLRHSLSVEGNHLPSCQVANSNPNKEGGTKALVFLTFSEVFGIRTEQSASGIHPTKVHSPYGMRFVDLG